MYASQESDKTNKRKKLQEMENTQETKKSKEPVLLLPYKAAEMLGVTTATLRQWSKAGLIKSQLTASSHHRYPLAEVNRILSRTGTNTTSSYQPAPSLTPYDRAGFDVDDVTEDKPEAITLHNLHKHLAATYKWNL